LRTYCLCVWNGERVCGGFSAGQTGGWGRFGRGVGFVTNIKRNMINKINNNELRSMDIINDPFIVIIF
jgi:hypothetical protein